MAVLSTNPTFFPRRLSQYVPAMQYASDVNISGESRITFGTPIAAAATTILSALSVAAAAVTPASGLLVTTLDGNFGRNIQIVLSNAGTGNIIVDGWDYLGQPMSETLALNGATPVLGLKAFKFLRQITNPIVAAVTMNVGVGAKLGFPFKCGRVLTEELDGAVVATLGTLTAPVLTDPATATTGEPRGMFTPQSTLTGSAELTGTFEFYGTVNAANNGGLHGIAHFSN